MLDNDLKNLVDMAKLDLICYIDMLEQRIHDRDVMIDQLQNKLYGHVKCNCSDD